MSSPVRWSRFTSSSPDARLHWQGEPTRWSLPHERLRVEPDAPTDFWQRTHYGFQVDSGHYLYAGVTGDLVMTTHVSFHAKNQYDQAGLMVRRSASCWLKTSVEHEPGAKARLGAVVTNRGYSDWSTQPFDGNEVWLRIRREGDDFIVDASENGSVWEQIRMAHLDLREGADGDGPLELTAGVYACSPKAPGFVAEFSQLDISAGRLA